MVDDIAIQDFVKAIKEPPQDTNKTYGAIVSRVDNDGVVWVNLYGSDKETPTASTSSEVKRGDTVNVNWRNNKLYIEGNYSDPAAGMDRVKAVEGDAKDALKGVSKALVIAEEAGETANKYITEISYGGIMVHPEDDGESGVQISDDIEIIQDGVSIALYGGTARIGAVSSKHIVVDSNGMTYYKGSETEANKVAVFGSDISLYRGNKSVVISSRGINLTGEVYAEGNIIAGGNIDLGDSGRIYMPNNYAIHAMHALSDTTDPLIFISQSDNIVIGSEDWNDCYVHCVYSPQSGTSSLVPNVRITDAHRLTRTTHANSSVRFKHDIKDVENKELDPHNLYDIEVKQFRYNDDVITDPKDCRYHKDLIGFIAEQVRDVYPVAVDINENGECEAWSPQYIVPPMLRLIQELHEEVEQLKSELSQLARKENK